MTGTTRIGRLLVTVLAVLVFASLLTPVCTMPDCDKIDVGTCSDFQRACDDCPEQLVMKHTHDDALRAQSPTLAEPALVAWIELPDAAQMVDLAPALPEATASPPPLDPLGVRLTI